MSQTPPTRPAGITILAILAGIVGVLGLLGAVTALGIGAAAFGGLGAIVGLFFLVQAALILAFAYGAWTLRPWGWVLGIIGAGIGVILGGLQLLDGDTSAIISVAFNGLILYYLNTPEIRRAFGRG
jgi:hypothetical protein